MKRTGRTLSLTNTISSIVPPNSIASGGLRLTTIFEDDREGYAWKVKKMEQFFIAPNDGTDMSLFSTRVDDFTNLANFQAWAFNLAPTSNQLIAVCVYDTKNNIAYDSIKDNHMAVNTLSLFYPDGLQIPYYNITLEEYQISDSEEIMFLIKETGQSLNQIGE